MNITIKRNKNGVNIPLFLKWWLKTKGIGALFLLTCSICLCMLTTSFPIALSKGRDVLLLGYCHYAILMYIIVTYGWHNFAPYEILIKK